MILGLFPVEYMSYLTSSDTGHVMAFSPISYCPGIMPSGSKPPKPAPSFALLPVIKGWTC